MTILGELQSDFCKNLTEFYQISLKIFPNLTDFSPQLMAYMANSGDPDQALCSAASDLGLHCSPMSQKGDARLIWVNIKIMLNQAF